MKKEILKGPPPHQKFWCGGKKEKWQDLPCGGVIDEPATSLYNLTGDWRLGLRPEWDEQKCIQCGLCWVNCPDNAIGTKNGKRIKTDLNYCKGCGICAQICPVKAIKMVKEKMSE